MKTAVLVLKPETLAELMHLPKGAVIADLRMSFERCGVIEVLIRGAGWEASPGEAMVRVNEPQFRWELPE